MTGKAKTQAGVSSRSGTRPPEHTQFGKPGGNKQGRGFWRREDTPRYKLEQMMKLSELELTGIIENQEAPKFERNLARAVKDGNWNVIQQMTDQVYGYPKQTVEQTNLEPPKPLSPRKK